jgi:hypothetical protein
VLLLDPEPVATDGRFLFQERGEAAASVFLLEDSMGVWWGRDMQSNGLLG